MEYEYVVSIIILFLLLVMSAFFSGSETAFFSLNLLEQEKLKKNKHRKVAKFITRILDSPEDILITILTGNMVVNLFFASIMDRIVARYIETNAWVYSIIFGTLLVLIFGEMTPKNIAIRHSPSFFAFAARPLFVIYTFLMPIRVGVKVIEKKIIAIISRRINRHGDDSRRLIISTLQMGMRKGILHRSELAVLESFLDFREKTADEVMIPRAGLQGVEACTPPLEVLHQLGNLEKFQPSMRNGLIPVFAEDMDHIVGYFKIEDLLPHCYGITKSHSLKEIASPVHPVPEKKNLLDLMKEMIESDIGMALVVDEYGGTAGVVTFQHLVEDFLSFFYPSDGTDYVRISEGVYRFPGHYDLENLERLLQTEFNSESRTLAGLIIDTMGEIPRKGEELSMAGHTFTIKQVSHKRILEVQIRKAE